MSRKIKIIIAVAAGVLILALGTGAVVMAAGGTTTTTTPATTAAKSNPLFANVATALGVTEQQLTDAFKAAGTQTAQTAIDKALADAVTKGTITQAESDAIKAWLAQRPTTGSKDDLKAWLDARPTIANKDGFKGLFGFGGWMWGREKGLSADTNNTDFMTAVATALNAATGKSITVTQLQDAFTAAQSQIKADALKTELANAVSSGKITQAEADQIQSWWNSRPAALDKLAPNGGFCIPGMGRGGKGPGSGFNGPPSFDGGMMPGFNGRMNGNGI